MVWTVLSPTWTSGQPITSSYLNSVASNFAETAPGKATTAGYHFASVGTNSIAERAIVLANVDAQESIASSGSYGDLATVGPTTATITTGSKALIWISAQLGNSAAGQSYASYGVSGASTLAPSDNIAAVAEGTAGALPVSSRADLRSITAGSNAFYLQYRATSGNITALRRRIVVMAL